MDHTGRGLGVTKGFPGAQNDKTIIRFDGTVLAIRDEPQYRDCVYQLRRKDGELRNVKGNYLIVDNGYHKVRTVSDGLGLQGSTRALSQGKQCCQRIDPSVVIQEVIFATTTVFSPRSIRI